MTKHKRFTDSFIAYANEFTDCPDPFLMWGALLTISGSLSRSVFVEVGSWNISPHLWLILIGKSSSHKSTALSIAENLIEQVDPDRCAPHEFSAEAVITLLSKQANRFFVFDEAKSFFDMVGKKYNESLKSLFTILYRKPNYTRQTLKHGLLSIRGAYLPIGMATTPEWLRASLQDAQEAALSGFLARFIMIAYLDDQERPLALPPPHSVEKFKELESMLWEFKKIEQAFVYTPEARAALEVWYGATTKRQARALPVLGPFFEHMKNEAIHKLGILLAVDRDEREIGVEAIEEAILCLRYMEDMMPALVQDLTDNRLDRDRRKIAEYIKSHGVCVREDLAIAVRVHGEILTRHLAGMEQDNLLIIAKKKGTTRPITEITWVGADR